MRTKSIVPTFARFRSQPVGVPPGLTCISAFVLVKKEGSILLGKLTSPEEWFDEFSLYRDRPEAWMNKWRIPGSHLRQGEHPEDAARRILEKQLGVGDFKLHLYQVQSHTSTMRPGPEDIHWDICFIYDATTSQEPKSNQYFSEVSYFKAEDINIDELGSQHGGIIPKLKDPKGRVN